MKFFTVLILLVSSILTHAEAPPMSRGPRYNPPGNRGTVYRPGPAPSRPSGPRYNPPAPTSRPWQGPVVTRPAPSPTRPTGPRYNPPSGPRPLPPVGGYNPRPTGPRYNPPTPGRVVVSKPPRYQRPQRTYYGTPHYHRPYGHVQLPYSRYSHVPYRTYFPHTTRFYRSYDWYNYVWSSNPQYIYVNWIFYPASGYGNGHWVIDNYPYYVFNSYRYRYSQIDFCNYQLVDSWNHQVVTQYWNQQCNIGYDNCSFERDRLNTQMGEYRYFCSETFRDESYDYSTPSYDTSSEEETCQDWDNDGYCD